MKSDKPILFLDVDGVLNNTEAFKSQRSMFALCGQAINRLRRVVDDTGCLIVLSSYWRFNPDSMHILRIRLAEKGIEIYDTTQVKHITG